MRRADHFVPETERLVWMVQVRPGQGRAYLGRVPFSEQRLELMLRGVFLEVQKF